MMLVFRKIWAVYAVSAFLLLVLLGVPVLLFNMAATPGERALKRNVRFLHHTIGPVFLALAGIRLKISGRTHLRPGVSYVIVANHRSSIDFIVNAVAFPGIFRFLAKQELMKIPIFGWVVKKMCLTVDRSSAMSRARSVVEIKKQLARGWSVLIYPEGGRNRTESPLAPFYDGAFRIAIQTGAPIAIQTVQNVEAVSASVKSVDLCPGTLYIAWDEPIETAQLTAEDIPALKEAVRNRMNVHLQHQN
jgi:1-acyl-sn-glycerol-3-phosphate acyltransferase